MDWLSLPSYGSVAFSVGLVLAVIAVLCAVCAVAPIPVGGGVGSLERDRARFNRWLALIGALAPVPCAIAVLNFAAPIKRPVDIILVSRSLASPAYFQTLNGHADDVIEAHPGLLDTNGIVAHALAELESQNENWSRDNPSQQDLLSQSVVHSVDSQDLKPVEERVDTSTSSLPRWVIESVELSVLKALTQRYNIRNAFIVGFNRSTLLGSTWDLAKPYLEHGSIRSRGTHVEVVSIPEGAVADLVAAKLESTVSNGTSLSIWLDVPACSRDCSVVDDLPFAIYGNSILLHHQTVRVARSTTAHIEMISIPVTLGADAMGSRLTVVMAGTGRVRTVQKALGVDTDIAVTIVSRQSELWSQTLVHLSTSNEPDVLAWRESLLRFGLDVRRVKFSFEPDCSAGIRTAVVVRDCDKFVSISPSDLPIRKGHPMENPSIDSLRVFRTRLTQLGRFGINSLDGTFVWSNELAVYGEGEGGSLQNSCVLSQLESIPGRIEDGSLPDSKSRLPFEAGMDFSLADGSDTNSTSIFVNSEATLLFGTLNSSRALDSFYGLWSELFFAIRSSAAGGWICGHGSTDSEHLPAEAVLTSSDLQVIQGSSARLQLSALLFCLFLYAIMFHRGMRALRVR